MIRTSKLALFVVLLVSSTVAAGKDKKEDAAPPGCHWQDVPAVKMHLSVPDGWQFRDTSSGSSKSYEVIPAGPGLENSKARYLLEVHRKISKTEVVTKAREFVEAVRSAGVDSQPLEQQTNGAMTFFSSYANYIPNSPGAIGLGVVVSSAANSRTGTLYTMRFNIPLSELEAVAPLGNNLFQTIRLDDEF